MAEKYYGFSNNATGDLVVHYGAGDAIAIEAFDAGLATERPACELA